MPTDTESYKPPRAEAEQLQPDRFKQRYFKDDKFYHTPAWRRLRAQLLRRRRIDDEPVALELYHRDDSDITLTQYNHWLHSNLPLCQASLAAGRIEPGNVLDHILPISQGGARLDPDNLQFLSARAHNAKK